MNNKIRLGIIGPGLIWEHAHKPVLKKLEDKFEIAAFCATSERSKNKINKEYPVMPFYKDYKALLREPFIDAVVILTPIPLNPVIALAALDAGKDVFMEKPMATNAGEAKELVKKEKKTGKRVFILEQYVYKSYTDEILKVINSGRLGDVLVFEKIYHDYIGYKEDAKGYGNTEWRINPKYPLGMLLDGGIHEIATLSKIFGRPLSVYAAGIKYRQDGYGDYDYQSMVFGYGNNSIGVFSNSYYLDGERNYLIIRGTKGLLFYEHGPEITVEENNSSKEIIKLRNEDPTYNMWKDFSNCLESNSKPYYTTKKALDDLQILEAVKKSLENESRINIE